MIETLTCRNFELKIQPLMEVYGYRAKFIAEVYFEKIPRPCRWLAAPNHVELEQGFLSDEISG